jgi:23S rRNA (guanosine2251-2'-O)-methyltransferase
VKRAACAAPTRDLLASGVIIQSEAMLIHGFHAVLARIKREPGSIQALYVAVGRDDARVRELVGLAQRAGLKPNLVESDRIERMVPGRRHQGVVAQVREAAAAAVPDLQTLLEGLDGPAFLLLLDGVTDPRNLGACLRVANGAGVQAVIAPKDNACMLTEVAVHTASGAAEHVPYLMVTNLAAAISELKEHGVWVIGTSDDAPGSLYEQSLPASVAWVLGAEGKGLRRLTRTRCDQLVSIPMAGAVASLNVSVAAGVVLYETMRQTRVRARGATPASATGHGRG